MIMTKPTTTKAKAKAKVVSKAQRRNKRATTPKLHERILSLSDYLFASLERLRVLIGDNAKLNILVEAPERQTFDQITAPGEIVRSCEAHGVHLKGIAKGDVRLLLLHVAPSNGAFADDETISPA
jgi:hypothetical protein